MINYFSESSGLGLVRVRYIIAMTPVKLHTHLPNKNHSFDACAGRPRCHGAFEQICNLSAGVET